MQEMEHTLIHLRIIINLFTIRQHKGKLAGLKVAIIGDIAHSRVARSDIWGMRKMGIEVHLAGPKTLLPRFLQEEPGILYMTA